ncbi:cytochrome P450 [Trinickia acidisoli]|uniref:cytochrome P450 n=1 Tax=Trinickia acidisoli TaxID=2767482 RepID=UPI001F5DDA94|nr:cytochrome P450 [Trinickia acidisoli]
MLTRYDDIALVMSDLRFSAERVLPRDRADGGATLMSMALARQMLFLDPPDHNRLRKLFAKAFTPRRLEGLRPHIAEIANGLLDRAATAGIRIDFIGDFAAPLPVAVIAQMLGMPREDWPRLRVWSRAFGQLIAGRTLCASEFQQAEQDIGAFIEYCRGLITQRRQCPENDMLSDLIAVEEMGDRLSEQELIMNLILLFAAGHGTTTHLLGNGLLALLTHPDQWRRLLDDESIMSTAVNELLRFDAPIQVTSREASEDILLAGKLIRAGELVRVFLGSANRDPEHFTDPDTLDVRRSGARILSFGHGIHTCLGSALAKLEAEIAFTELIRRFPHARIEEQALQRAPSVSLRGLRRLTVTLG